MKTAWVWVVTMLAACSSPASETAEPKETASETPSAGTAAPAKTTAALTLAPDGLSIVEAPPGQARLVPFGTPRAVAERMVGSVQGEQLGKGSSAECGAGKIDYTSYEGDLQLTFQQNKFVGWTINGGESPLRTAKGIGVGSTRQQLDAAYKVDVEDSSLGLLFSTGDLVGLLDIDGIDGLVTSIWAGTVCLID